MSQVVKQQGGEARSPAISVQDLLREEKGPVPDHLTLENNPDTGDTPIPSSYYISSEQHDLEAEKVWPPRVASGLSRRRHHE